MNRIVRACALIGLCGMFVGCLPFQLFQDVGTDPHPPNVQLLGVGYQPTATAAEGETKPEPVFVSPDGFVVRPTDDVEKSLIMKVEFTDIGGDVTTFTLRDLDSSFTSSLTPTAAEIDIDGDGDLEVLTTADYFTGTSAIVIFMDIEIGSMMQGPHRLELWAEDSHESRSEKVSFTITVEI